MDKPSHVFEIIDHTIRSSGNRLSIKALCEIAGVSRSGYYAWVKAAPARKAAEEQDRRDFNLILEAYKARGYKKGAESVYMNLLHMDPPVIMNVKKIRRLMKKFRLVCPIRKANPYRSAAKAMKTGNVADNLLQREFECYGPRMVLLTDVTYLSYNGTFAYLSTILDAFTKQILSYAVSESLEVDFVLETVNILLRDHGVSLKQETILHSDQGCHYTSYRFIDIVSNKRLRRSMSRKGNCWDNAPQESFFGHMKDHVRERLKEAGDFQTVRAIIDDYMDYYNNERYQWHLAKLAPNEYYQFCVTGEYPIRIPNPPAPPVIRKKPEELGRAKDHSRKDNGEGRESRSEVPCRSGASTQDHITTEYLNRGDDRCPNARKQ